MTLAHQMKTIGIGFLFCLMSVPVFGQTNTTAQLTRLSPVRIPGISDIVGTPTNHWLYAWPHDLVPDTFRGLGVKSTPVDRTKKNQGCTMQNWGRPVELTNATTKIAITCRCDYPMSTSQPWQEDAAQLRHYASFDFHGLPAGMATLTSGAASTLCFVFKQNGVVFDMTVRGEDKSACKAAVFSAAEQIWRFNLKEAPTTPPTLR